MQTKKDAFIEVWSAGRVGQIVLVGDRVSLGRSPRNDVVIDDPQISRVHAVMERLAGSWSIRDVSSRNGTFVNGGRLSQQVALRAGDEVLIGRTRLVLHDSDGESCGEATAAHHPSPRLTHRERDTLVALYQPVSASDTFTEPATPREIARALWITEAAVRHHLSSLYDKFGIEGTGEQRRTRLANEALRRGAITLAEVRATRETWAASTAV